MILDLPKRKLRLGGLRPLSPSKGRTGAVGLLSVSQREHRHLLPSSSTLSQLPTSTQAFSMGVTDITTNPSYYVGAGVLTSDPKVCVAGTFLTGHLFVPQVVNFRASELSLGF